MSLCVELELNNIGQIKGKNEQKSTVNVGEFIQFWLNVISTILWLFFFFILFLFLFWLFVCFLDLLFVSLLSHNDLISFPKFYDLALYNLVNMALCIPIHEINSYNDENFHLEIYTESLLRVLEIRYQNDNIIGIWFVSFAML